MLNIAGGLTVLVLTQLFFINAWLSAGSRPWQYYLWAALAILLWGQPWSRSDPYRTNKLSFRLAVYGVLILLTIVSAYVFNRFQPLLVGLETFVLGLLELTGQRPIQKTRH